MAITDRRGITVDATTPASASDPHPGLAIKAAVRLATTANITLSGLQTIDGVAAAADDRILVKDQSTASQNGIYVASSGNWTRARDMNDNSEVADGCLVFVRAGTVAGGFLYRLSGTDPITVGTTSMSFVQFGASAATLATILALANTVPAIDESVDDILAATLLTRNDESALLANSRRLAVSTPLTLTDAGAGSTLTLGLSSTPFVGGRNYLDNSSFVIVQRGTGSWTAGSATLTVDRWGATRFGTAGATFSRETNTGARFCMQARRDPSNSSTQILALYQALDTNRSKELVGLEVTLSFYALAGANYSATSEHLVSRITTGTGTDQAMSGAPAVSWTGGASDSQNNVISTTRTLFSHTHTIPSGTTQVGVSFLFTPTGTAGANDWFQIDSVKLEIGDAPTTYSPNPDREELAACAMFYEDMARNPFTGDADLRVISQGSANTAGAGSGTDQNIWAYIHHLPKRNVSHTLTLGTPSTGMHFTFAGGSSVYDLEEGTSAGGPTDLWSHTTTQDSLLQMHYLSDGAIGSGSDHPSLANYHQFLLALDGGATGSKFAIDCDLAP